MPPDRAPENNDGKKNEIDLGKILLPKKGGLSPDSAQRVNAGALFEQEKAAGEQGPAKPEPPAQKPPASGEINTTPTPPAGTSTPPQKKEESTIKPLQTYSGDIAGVIEAGGVSSVSIATAEAKRKGEEKPEAPQEPLISRSALLYGLGGGALLVLAGAALVAVFYHPAVALPPEVTAPFLTVDSRVEVPVPPGTERDALMNSLESGKDGVKLSLGLVAQLFVGAPTSTGLVELPAQDFLSLLAPNIPQDLLRTLEPRYLLGVHSFDENDAFLILKVDSYQQAYAGMLQWEDTMRGELSPLFVRHPSPHLPAPGQGSAATSTATTTPGAPSPLQSRFVDQVVENRDARVALNSAGDILMLWTFLDRSTLIITNNADTLRTIVRRLTDTPIIPQP